MAVIYDIPELGPEERAALSQIDELRRQLRFSVADPKRWVGSVRRVLAARAIQGSNSIEGYNVSVEDAVAAIEGDEPTTAEKEDWNAVLGYRRAMTYVIQMAQDPHFELTPAVVRSLHFMMTEYSLDAGPGLWRPGAIWIRNDLTGEVVYEGPDAEVVPALMAQVVAQMVAADDVPPMVSAAVAHLNVAMVHPFRDGNRRMARCLQTLVLARDGILAPELSSIEEYLGANTRRYYDVLGEVGHGAWHPDNDARPWVRFCLEAHFVQATSVLRRIRESQQVWLAIETLAHDHGLHERTLDALFDATIGLRIRNSSYRASLATWGAEISNQTATIDLAKMVAAGLLEKHGEKRGTYYLAADALRQVRQRLVVGRQPIDVSGLFAVPDAPNNDPELPFR
jgi:Fic family protein